MADSPLFGRVALIGIGLIGSSLARAMRQHKLAGHIAGHAKSERTRNTALKLGLVDSIHADPAAAVAGADLTVVCTPLGAYAAIGAAIGSHLKPGSTLTDVGW
jgi:cyclohexadieny/prephenate dehydrogenase